MKREMMKDMEMEDEAKKEGETPEEESGEYQHIDDFIEGLDKEEISYLKDCLSKMESSDKESKPEKMMSEDDFED